MQKKSDLKLFSPCCGDLCELHYCKSSLINIRVSPSCGDLCELHRCKSSLKNISGVPSCGDLCELHIESKRKVVIV